MDEQIRYIIVAGINGARKSTLYRARPGLFTHSERLNADEILQKWVVIIRQFTELLPPRRQFKVSSNDCKLIITFRLHQRNYKPITLMFFNFFFFQIISANKFTDFKSFVIK